MEGLLIEVSDEVRSFLRIKEGWNRCYSELDVHVMVPGSRTSISAFTYIVVPELQVTHDLPVKSEYRRLILDAAKEHRFSQTYQRSLERILHPVAISRPIEVAS